MRKKPISILKRDSLGVRRQKKHQVQSKSKAAAPQLEIVHGASELQLERPAKRARRDADHQNSPQLDNDGVAAAKPWNCHSAVDRQAATAVKRLLSAHKSGQHGASVKSLTLAPHIQAPKATFKVTCETLKYFAVLTKLLQSAGLLQKHRRLSESVAAVLVYEAVFGEGLKPHGPAERAVLAAQEELFRAAEQLKNEAGVEDIAALVGSSPHERHPRAARVNTLKISVKEALSHLRNPGNPGWQPAFKDVSKDDLLTDVLIFPTGTDVHAHPLVANGSLILQSKASCMPARALQPQPGWTILDACAAPGNKTTHIAALMGDRGRVLAFDRDPKRLERLKANAALTGATSIEAHCRDFLETDPFSAELAGVQGILLDPSCSGSGTVVSRMDHFLPSVADSARDTEKQRRRIAALAAFQEAALRHALQFPKLQRLVYSTCSVHPEENELVVAAVLPEAQGFELADPFPGWQRRGLPLVSGAEKLVKTDAAEDGTDGFFVAVFQKLLEK